MKESVALYKVKFCIIRNKNVRLLEKVASKKIEEMEQFQEENTLRKLSQITSVNLNSTGSVEDADSGLATDYQRPPRVER
jgi:hypothetical protein